MSAYLVENLIQETFKRKAWDNITVIMICFKNFVEIIKNFENQPINICDNLDLNEISYSNDNNFLARKFKDDKKKAISKKQENPILKEKYEFSKNNKKDNNSDDKFIDIENRDQNKQRSDYITDKSFNEKVLPSKNYNEKGNLEKCFNENCYIDKKLIDQKDKKFLSKSDNFKGGVYTSIGQKDLRGL